MNSQISDNLLTDNLLTDNLLTDNQHIEVLYNDCYGSWGISNKANKLYTLRKTKDYDYNNYLRRSDPILIQIYNELGHEFDNKHSKTTIQKIPKKYENYYYITEYDGLETVEIDYTKYELDILKKNIKLILQNNTIDNNHKIYLINKIFF